MVFRRTKWGFTFVEIIIIVSIVAVLAVIAVVGYIGVQRRSVDTLVAHTVADAHKNLQAFNVFNKYYPSNIAATDYAPPLEVGVALYTDAPQTPVYANLNDDQNAQLFLNACNGYMPVVDAGVTYNTSCTYNGNNEHVAGTISSNVVIQGPTINQSDFVLKCGAACNAAQANVINTFLAQGGHFPVMVPKKGSTLPAPTLTTDPGGRATKYCIEGRSSQFSDIIYHATPDTSPQEPGPCPVLGLHYP